MMIFSPLLCVISCLVVIMFFSGATATHRQTLTAMTDICLGQNSNCYTEDQWEL